MTQDKTKTIVYPNGDILQIPIVWDALVIFWGMSKAEKRALRRMIDKYPTCPKEWEELIKNDPQ